MYTVLNHEHQFVFVIFLIKRAQIAELEIKAATITAPSSLPVSTQVVLCRSLPHLNMNQNLMHSTRTSSHFSVFKFKEFQRFLFSLSLSLHTHTTLVLFDSRLL